jgi:hypothetical protein
MTYAQLVTRLEVLCATTVAEDASFAAILPAAIESGELRCLRDCDFPSARRVSNVTVGPGQEEVPLPADQVVTRGVWLRDPSDTRVALERRDVSYLREYAPDMRVRGRPKYYAQQASGTLLLAPVPSALATVDVEVTYRPPGLVAETGGTWLSQRYPDLLLYAVMIFMAGYQKNFGAQADDPQMPGSWARMYTDAVAVARNEAATGKGWGPFDRSPTPAPSALAPAG